MNWLGAEPSAPNLATPAPWAQVCALIGLHIPGFILQARVAAGWHRGFWPVLLVHGLVQFVWLQSVAWFALPFVPLIALSLLFALSFGWAFNDAHTLYDEPQLKLIHLLACPVFDLLLLGADLLGYRGLLATYRLSPSTVLNFLGMQLVLLVLVQMLIAFVGKSAREQAAREDQAAEQQREMAVLRSERLLFQRLTGLLGHGLLVGRFSHDVASPLTVLVSGVDLLKPALLRQPGTSEEQEEALATLEDMSEAGRRILGMTASLARAVKSPEKTTQQPLAELVKQAVEAAKTGLAGHDVGAMLPPEVELEETNVWITEGHVAAIGNLLTNGVLQAPEQALELQARTLNQWFCLLELRDHGVSPEERPARLAKVNRSLSLEGELRESGSDPPGYRGYGIGLMLAKIVIVRHGGWISAQAPESGNGLVLRLVLPRCEPASLPSDVDASQALATQS